MSSCFRSTKPSRPGIATRELSGEAGSFSKAAIADGCCGVISVVSNIAPRELSGFTRLCLEGRFEAARERQGRILELTRPCFLDTNPIPVKAALAMMGRIGEAYRLPLVSLSSCSLIYGT